ncbi:MAG TPA: hypothetical protein ENJ93_05195, partial [Chloroflexi bacterium]|nr:hypothetical protein [Chloroflexota bacterium]
MNAKKGIPIFIAILFGGLTLLGLLFNLPALNSLMLGWAGFIAGFALLLGILNLLYVHSHRTIKKKNIYSAILVFSMLGVFVLAVTDNMGLTDNGVQTTFNWALAPLEAALASLLAFFLLFAGFQMLKRQRTIWSILFILTAILILVSNALAVSTLLPQNINQIVIQVQHVIQNIIVLAGMRGLLLGIAL